MKMKRITLSFSILALTTALIVSCNKKTNTPPEPDQEIQSSVYASYSNYVASDIDMICSFLAEDNQFNHPYSAYPNTTGTITAVRDTNGIVLDPNVTPIVEYDQLVLSWNNTKCKDGRVRDGSIFMLIPQIGGQRYGRNPKFAARITFQNYTVDGWKIGLADSAAPMYLYNTTPANYNPKNVNLTFRFAGKMNINHPTEASKNMVWDGNYIKTLLNTSDPKVVPSTTTAIVWKNAKFSYSGTVNGSGPQISESGVVTPGVKYSMSIDALAPLVRDFKCNSDTLSGIAFTPTVNVLQIITEEHHPFISGIGSFTVGSGYPRQIYYGNEGNTQTAVQCDNVGEVLLKGITYRINFMK